MTDWVWDSWREANSVFKHTCFLYHQTPIISRLMHLAINHLHLWQFFSWEANARERRAELSSCIRENCHPTNIFLVIRHDCFWFVYEHWRHKISVFAQLFFVKFDIAQYGKIFRKLFHRFKKNHFYCKFSVSKECYSLNKS